MGFSAGSSLAFPSIIPAGVLGQNAPSKRITLGCIGMGSQGVYANLNSFLNYADAQVVSACDAYRSRAVAARDMVDKRYGTKGCRAFQDFREIIGDPAVDAVVISTPDHWHVPMSVMAIEAGKDVFSEKPTLSIDEGVQLEAAVKKHKKVFQAGIEDRSMIHFHKMVEWVRNGAIGKLRRVEVHLPRGCSFPVEQPVAPPEDLDWNLWQGPAEFHEYTPSRTDCWHWRNISQYSNGAILDMGTHLFDTAQLGVDAPEVCPVEVEGSGEIPQGMESDVPVTFDLNYRYSNGVEVRLRNGAQGFWAPDSCYLNFEGETGWIRRKTWSAGLEASDPQILRIRYAPENTKHWPLPKNEQRDFLDCVKSRQPTTYTAETLHLLSTSLHMGVIAIRLGRKLQWDMAKGAFVDDAEANRMRMLPQARKWENSK